MGLLVGVQRYLREREVKKKPQADGSVTEALVFCEVCRLLLLPYRRMHDILLCSPRQPKNRMLHHVRMKRMSFASRKHPTEEQKEWHAQDLQGIHCESTRRVQLLYTTVTITNMSDGKMHPEFFILLRRRQLVMRDMHSLPPHHKSYSCGRPGSEMRKTCMMHPCTLHKTPYVSASDRCGHYSVDIRMGQG